ncbi:MAG: hypothetical protein ACT4P9_03575 [Betaproteobacteria bacterium]
MLFSESTVCVLRVRGVIRAAHYLHHILRRPPIVQVVGAHEGVAQAFCRGADKADPAKSVFFVVALASEKPFPLFLRRVEAP